MHMSKVSIRDVAALAGVSTATVSHVINNTRYVKEETKRLVLKSIEELHYSPDATARSFKTGKRNLIAFIVPDISNPFFATMIEEVENVISKEGFNKSALFPVYLYPFTSPVFKKDDACKHHPLDSS